MPRRSAHPVSTIGPRLKQARVGRGLSLRALAGAIGISHVALWEIEQGRHEPMCGTLTDLCRELGLSADYVLGLRKHP